MSVSVISRVSDVSFPGLMVLMETQEIEHASGVFGCIRGISGIVTRDLSL